jgi:predicted dithiol-disulfide oxidoreductase (DUF899 family)
MTKHNTGNVKYGSQLTRRGYELARRRQELPWGAVMARNEFTGRGIEAARAQPLLRPGSRVFLYGPAPKA